MGQAALEDRFDWPVVTPHLKFELSLTALLGIPMRKSQEVAEEVWGGLAGVRWIHMDHGSIGFSHRAAAEVVARIRGGTWLDYYLSVPSGEPPAEMAARLAEHGWAWEPR